MNSLTFKIFSLLCLATFATGSVADTEQMVQLDHAAHVCNNEEETIRLAANDHLREMAKALVEFKATKYCFIMQPSQTVKLLEIKGNYIKFAHNSQVLFTFIEHVVEKEQFLSQQRL